MPDKEKTAWDRIPPIDFETDEVSSLATKPKCGRKHTRTDLASLNKILDEKVSFLPAKMASGRSGHFKGMVLDISENGCRVAVSSVQLEKGELTKVGFIVNKRTIISKAIVRWILPQSHGYLVGMEFIELPDDSKEFLWTIGSVAKMDSVEISKIKQALR